MTTQQLDDPSTTKRVLNPSRESGTAMDLIEIRFLTGDNLGRSELEKYLEAANTGHPISKTVFANGLKSAEIQAAVNQLKALADEQPTDI